MGSYIHQLIRGDISAHIDHQLNMWLQAAADKRLLQMYIDS
jgi:hypothetical protein